MTTPATALIGPDGKEYVLTNPDALEALREQGFRTPDEAPAPSGLGREPGAETPIEAGIDVYKGATTGLLRGMTAGLSDVAAEAVEPSGKATYLKEIEERAPIASGVGELAGMVASPINKAGETVRGSLKATSALGRIGASALGGAASGVLFGAGKTVSDAALGDSDLTAQKLIAGAGLGALLGGLGGGVGGAIEEGARAVLPKVRTLAARAQTALDDIANDAAISSTRAQQGVINRIGDDKLQNVARVLRDRGHLQSTPEKMAESITKDREALGKTLGKVLDDLDAGGQTPDHMAFLKRLDDFENSLNPIQQDAIAGDLRSARTAIAKLGANDEGFRALDSVKRTIQDKAKFSKGPTPLDDVTMGLKRQIAGTVRDELDQQILPRLGSDAGRAFTDTKATYGALADAQRLAESGVGRVGERGALAYVGLKDLLAGNLLSGGSHAFGIAGALGAKVLRENGPAIVARIADKLAKEPALQAMAQSFAANLPTVAPKLGQYGAVLAQEAAVSPERALASHMAMAQLDPGYAAHAQLAGLEPETPDEHPAVMARAQTLAEAHAAGKAHEMSVTEAIERIAKGQRPEAASHVLKSQDFGAKRMRQDTVEAHKRRVEEIRQLATDPQALIDRTSKNLEGLSGVAPSVAASMTATAQRAVQYLATQAEVPLKAGPQAREWVPNETERHSFALKLEAVQAPMSVLRRAAAGTLVKQQLEAVRAVYPAFAKDLEDKALERLFSKEAIPYRSRQMLSMLAGISADGTSTPHAIAANQAAISKAGGREEQKMQAQKPSGDGKFDPASRLATPSQKRELQEGSNE